MTAQEIRAKAIEATVARMRKYGFEKVRLIDVARDLSLSHATLYAHFRDKSALLDAVTEQWLNETDALLGKICLRKKDPLQKIEKWFLKQYQLKRERILYDRELFRAFDVSAALKKPFVVAHLTELNRQLVGLVDQAGAVLGEDTPQHKATLLFEAMASFHHPRLVAEHCEQKREALLKRLLAVLLNGMHAGS
jgi:AcrR family transcriptional regulator